MLQRQQESARMPTKSAKAQTREERHKKREAKKNGNKDKKAKTDGQDAKDGTASGHNVASDLELVKNLLAAGSGLGGNVSVFASQEDKIKKLEAQLEAAKSKSEAALIMEKSADMLKEIIRQVKAYLYRDTKFVGNDKHLEKLANKCYDTMGYKLEKVPPNHKECWVAAYKDYVKKGFNEARSYVQQQLQNDFKAHLAKENLPADELVEKCGWITPDLAKKCALRTVNLDDAAEFEAFKWYWTVGLQKELGHSEWGPNKHLYQMPSQATTKRTHNGKEAKLVTPQSEAMLVMFIDNARGKWVHERAYQLKNGYDGMSGQAKKNFKYPSEKVGDKMRVKPEYQPKHTDMYGGKQVTDGWTFDGKKQFTGLRKEIKDHHAANMEQVLALEKRMFDHLRKENGITAPDAITHRKNKRRKVVDEGLDQASSMEEEEELVMDFSDEEN